MNRRAADSVVAPSAVLTTNVLEHVNGYLQNIPGRHRKEDRGERLGVIPMGRSLRFQRMWATAFVKPGPGPFRLKPVDPDRLLVIWDDQIEPVPASPSTPAQSQKSADAPSQPTVTPPDKALPKMIAVQRGGRPSARVEIRAACRTLGKLPAEYGSNGSFLRMFRRVPGVPPPPPKGKGWSDDAILGALRNWDFTLADDAKVKPQN